MEKHFTDYLDEIKSKIKEKDFDKAEELLLKCVELTEKESAKNKWGVAPGYYEKLGIIYRKQKNINKEIEILERFDKQIKAPGAGPKKLKERLMKLKNNVKLT
jgi:hypothetical protein